MSESLFKAVHTGYDMKNRPVHICVNEDETQYVYNPRTGFKSRSWPADSVDVQACFSRQVSNSQTHAHYLEEEKEIPVTVAAEETPAPAITEAPAAPPAEETPAPANTEAPAAPAAEETPAPVITDSPAVDQTPVAGVTPAAEQTPAPVIIDSPAAPAAAQTPAPVKAAKKKSATKPKAAKKAAKKASKKAAKKKSATAKK